MASHDNGPGFLAPECEECGSHDTFETRTAGLFACEDCGAYFEEAEIRPPTLVRTKRKKHFDDD